MRRWILVAVAIAAAGSILITRKPHVYEYAHFYLGAKYFPEIGYAGLYNAVAAAFDERHGRAMLREHAPRVSDLTSGEMITPDAAVAAFRAVQHRWTPSRWRSFLADVAFLEGAMARYAPRPPIRMWREYFADYGNNFPPAWVAYVHPLVRDIPLDDKTLRLFNAVDMFYFAGIFLVLGAVWGLPAAVTALLFAASATDLLAYAAWSLAKFDWLFALALALLCFKRRRPAAAGALWGTAAALRIFPAPLAVLFAAAWMLSQRDRAAVRHEVLRFVGGLTVAFAAGNTVASVALARWSGLSWQALWEGYARRLGLYAGAEIANRIGVGKILAQTGGGAPAWLGGIAAAALAGLLLIALARRPAPPERLAALSLLFTPSLFLLSHYYYLMLLIPIAAGERRLRWLTCWLFATNAAVIAAGAAGAPYASVLQGECLSYSIALALVPPALFFLGRGDSDTMTPAAASERNENAVPHLLS